MSRQLLPLAALIALSLTAGAAVAAPAGSGKPSIQLYKYKNDKGQVVIENSIPPEYATRGYQIITPSGTLIQDVPPAASQSDQDAARKKREEDAIMGRKDAELRKLYSSPEDAVRLRNRQMDAVSINVDFAKGQLLQLTNKRKAELEQAARIERKGQKVSQPMRDSIDRLNRNVQEKEAQIKAYEADREKIRADFQPIIERLNALYPDKAIALDVPAAAPAAPAPVAAPAAAAPKAAPAAAAPKAAPAAH